MIFNRLLAIFLILYFSTYYLSWPDYCIFIVFFSLKNVDPHDHYAACRVPLTLPKVDYHIAFESTCNDPHIIRPPWGNGKYGEGWSLVRAILDTNMFVL